MTDDLSEVVFLRSSIKYVSVDRTQANTGRTIFLMKFLFLEWVSCGCNAGFDFCFDSFDEGLC